MSSYCVNIQYQFILFSPQTFEGHSRMILQLIVTPKSFYSSSTDLTVRGWVYNMEECVRIYKGHQHSVSVIMLENNTRKLSYTRLPGQATTHCMPLGNLAWPNLDLDITSAAALTPFRSCTLKYYYYFLLRAWTATPTRSFLYWLSTG